MYGWHTILAVTEIPEVTKEEAVTWLKNLGPKLLQFGKTLLIALVVFAIGRRLIRWGIRIVHGFLERAKVDEGVIKFLSSAAKVVLNFILLLTITNILGLETSSLVALVGSAGLTIGLALQGSLSNFAGGVLILLLKPFRLGDYIIVSNDEGTVSSIDIFYTRLLTIDNKLVVIPNGTLSNSSMVNVTNEPIRRLDLIISVEYSEKIKKVKELLNRIAVENELVLTEPYTIDVFVNSFEASSVHLGLRVWVSTEKYWTLKWDLLEKIKETFDEEGIQIPYDQLDINIKKQDAKG